MIKTSGYEAAYQWFGIGQGIVVFVSGLLLRAPLQGEVAASASARVSQGKRDYAVPEMLRSPPFWLMYVMFVLVGSGGLMLQAQLAPIARDFAIDKVPVTILRVDHADTHFCRVASPSDEWIFTSGLWLAVRPNRS